LTVYVFNFR